MDEKCVSIIITGTVQGVGFRPFIQRIATTLGIKGTVCNTLDGVKINARCSALILNHFIGSIRNTPPTLSIINKIEVTDVKTLPQYDNFAIVKSIQKANTPSVTITRDTAVCPECLKEMRTSGNRRFNHAFINCTNCGPRYSIIKKVPYDRDFTSMAEFPMCSHCANEFADPSDRRFHAQPVCCPECGPQLILLDKERNRISDSDVLHKAKSLLSEGKIIAIKGIGGFHLACNAENKDAVNHLRMQKARTEKPFACMAKNIESATKYADFSIEELHLLDSPWCPIVLVRKKKLFADQFSNIAPGLQEVGLMLPYTPLHHLLFINAPYDLLVMTSANNNGEPMCTDDREIANNDIDAILTHDRSIIVRLDDSVVRQTRYGPVLLRRGRGYVPTSFSTPFNVDGIIGFGGQMKNSIAIGYHQQCFVSEYMGSTIYASVVEECWKTLNRLLTILNCKPQCTVSDLHPSGLIEHFSNSNIPSITVQHHHAHMAACMGENNLAGETIGVIYDGTGLGADGTIWGGEILIGDYENVSRAGHLKEMPLVGNDSAIENPARMAIAICSELMEECIQNIVPWISKDECLAVASLINKPHFTISTTSMGRLFDACAAILDICRKRTYEGQPAIELESAADPSCNESYNFSVYKEDNGILMDGRNLLISVIEDRDRGTPISTIVSRFHNTISQMTIKAVMDISNETGIRQVVLSGGSFGNKLLLQNVYEGLTEMGLQVFFHHSLPPGDENISYGQVLVAASRLLRNKP